MLAPTVAFAHGADQESGGWLFSGMAVIPLGVVLLLYTVGIARLWWRAGAGRGVTWWQMGCFVAGWTALGVALMSPLHGLGERLFSAHMIEHEVLMIVAAPALVLSRPFGAMLWAFPPSARQRLPAAHVGHFCE
ncbi:cytochrome c oxidase assembly protein [Mesorhizobium sp. ORM6]